MKTQSYSNYCKDSRNAYIDNENTADMTLVKAWCDSFLYAMKGNDSDTHRFSGYDDDVLLLTSDNSESDDVIFYDCTIPEVLDDILTNMLVEYTAALNGVTDIMEFIEAKSYDSTKRILDDFSDDWNAVEVDADGPTKAQDEALDAVLNKYCAILNRKVVYKDGNDYYGADQLVGLVRDFGDSVAVVAPANYPTARGAEPTMVAGCVSYKPSQLTNDELRDLLTMDYGGYIPLDEGDSAKVRFIEHIKVKK